MNIFAFTFATIPDINAGRKLYALDGLSDQNVAEVMFHRQRQINGSEQLPLHQQRIVALSALLRTADAIKWVTLGECSDSELELLQQFFALMEKHAPMLVTWNGAVFERPVMHHRSVFHGVGSNHYWNSSAHHLDLAAQFSGSDAEAVVPLDEFATLLDLPAKERRYNHWDLCLAGELEQIHNDITTDAFNVYLIHLRLQLVSGRLSQERYRSECQKLRELLQVQNRPHINGYMGRWSGGAA